MKSMIHATGDAIAVLSHLPDEQLRINTLHAFLAIAHRGQMEMDAAIENLLDVFIWKLEGSERFTDEQLFGLPLKDSLFGCLITDEEKQRITNAYPNPDLWIPEITDPTEEEEEDYGDDLFS